MPDQPPHLLLDQNVPEETAGWLRAKFPAWKIYHVKDVGLDGRPDPEIFRWAQANRTIVISYDEDFADPGHFRLARTTASSVCGCGQRRLRKPKSRSNGCSRMFRKKICAEASS